MSNVVEKSEVNTKCGFIALVGPANAGKSSLINALIGSKISIVTAKEQTTRFKVLGIKSNKESQFIFVDTPGFLARRYRGALSKFITAQASESTKDSDAVVLVLDSVSALKDRLYLDRSFASLKDQGVDQANIIVLNKIDLLDKLQLLPLIEKINSFFPENCPDVIPMSAKFSDGTDVLEQLLEKYLPQGPFLFPEDQNTDQAEHAIAAEVVREKLTNKLSREIPYSIVALVKEWKFRGKTLYIAIEIVVDRDSQKKIVIGSGGLILKSVGQEARLELEKLFEVPVFIDLHVKVQKDWTKDNLKVEQWHSRLLS